MRSPMLGSILIAMLSVRVHEAPFKSLNVVSIYFLMCLKI